MKIAIIASECTPFAKTGGLADVIGALPKYLASLGIDVRVFIPKYDSIDIRKFDLRPCDDIGAIPISIADIRRTVTVHSAVIPASSVPVYFVDCPEYFHRGTIYTDDTDEDERWILFNKGVIETLQRLRWAPDVIHCNDWQTGLMPLLVRENYGWDQLFMHTAFLFAIHNIGYQGRFPRETLIKGDLRQDLYYPYGPLEFNNTVSMMKAGIIFTDIISTVSETYSREILTEVQGAGMQDILRLRDADLYGVLNGIDTDEWNPATDLILPHRYTADDLSGKTLNKKFLLQKTTIPYNEKIPLIGIISRLVDQKGFDIVAGVMDELMALDAQWIILGSGDEKYEQLFTVMRDTYPSKCWCYIGFNNELAHLIEAGADIFLMPSHYEPCGLNQMYSLRYGTVPVVRQTGGLADTVLDWHEQRSYGQETGTGFTFKEISGDSLLRTVRRAIETYHTPSEWAILQRNGMMQDFSWEHSARRYIDLYHKAIHKRQ